KQIRQLRISFAALCIELRPGAFLRLLVRPEAHEARSVTEALALELVEADLTYQVRPYLVPRQVLATGPSRPAAGHTSLGAHLGELLCERALLRVERWKQLLQLRLERHRDAGGVADEVERAVIAV